MINVIWWDQGHGCWDSGLLTDIFNKHPSKFCQYNTKVTVPCESAIVIVVGKPVVEPLRAYLNTLKSGIVILTSDEDAYFDYKSSVPSHFEVWTQYYHHSRSDIKERVLIGYPSRLKDYKINRHLPKKYLWSFVGQVQNPFRQKCVEALKGLPDGFLQTVEFFGGNGENAMEYQEYLDIMCQSQFVLCPSGSMSADSFRLYEAIECGAIPITDRRSPRDPEGFNFWDEVYPLNQVIAVHEWDKVLLTEIMKVSTWWKNDWWFEYKKELENKLLDVAQKYAP